MSRRARGSARRGQVLFWVRIFLCLAIAGAAVFGALLGQIYSHARDELHGSPEVMIILGCQVKEWGPSMLLQEIGRAHV